MSARPIYLDNHATTPIDQRVLEAMLPYFTEQFGNAASISHVYGWEAEAAVKQSRQILAEAINASPEEIVFTSGATEANNLAIKGIAEAYFSKGKHIITVKTEHNAILDPCTYLQKLGFDITVLPVKSDGLIDIGDLIKAIRAETILVSVMTANNEIGVIQPIAEIAAICRGNDILFHTDAAQAIGKIPPRRTGDEYRSNVLDSPQNLRAKRHRCSLRAPQQTESAASAANARRWPRTGNAIGNSLPTANSRICQSSRIGNCRNGVGNRTSG